MILPLLASCSPTIVVAMCGTFEKKNESKTRKFWNEVGRGVALHRHNALESGCFPSCCMFNLIANETISLTLDG
jgi:hypothetical protein